MQAWNGRKGGEGPGSPCFLYGLKFAMIRYRGYGEALDKSHEVCAQAFTAAFGLCFLLAWSRTLNEASAEDQSPSEVRFRV